jgi:hypothetical protein
MMPQNSPLEHLAAFAIAFTMGVVSTIAISVYGKRMARAGAGDRKAATS